MRRSVVRCCVGLLAAGIGAGCDVFTGKKEERISLTLSSTEASVAQGGNTSLSVEVGRENFTKNVALTVTGTLPGGVVASFSLASVPNGTTTSTLLISATPQAVPGTVALTVKAAGEGVAEQTAVVNLTVTVTGDYSLSLIQSSLTVAQGGGGKATVLLGRTGGNAGNVTLAVTGAPAGVTATIGDSPTTDRATSLTVTADATAAAGNHTLTITGTSPGLPNKTTTLALAVITPPATATLTIPFCATGVPAWFAFQNQGYQWQRVTPAGSAVSFAATERLSVAFTQTSGSTSQVVVFSATRPELAALNDRDCAGPKTLTGSIAGVGSGQSGIIVMGTATANVGSSATSYTLNEVQDRALDLVATRGTISVDDFLTPDRMIVKRGLSPATGTALPALDFAGGDAFATATSTLTIGGLASGDQTEFQNSLWTATSTFGALQSGAATTNSVQLHSVPAARLATGDLHELFIDASTGSGTNGHAYATYFTSTGDRTDVLGPQLSTPTVTTATNSPYARLRGQLPLQASYPAAARFVFLQQGAGTNRFVVLVESSAFHGGSAPAMWDMTIPDFTGTPGFNATWMPGSGIVVYSAEGFAGRKELLFGALPAAGDVVTLGYRVAQTSGLLRASDASGARAVLGGARAGAGVLGLQYLRR